MSDWIKVFNSLRSHPKIVRAGDRAAWLYVCGLCYSNEHLTDGFLAEDVLIVVGPGVKQPEKLAAALASVGLWHRVEGGWQVHDYADVQRTASQIREHRDKDRKRKAKTDSGVTPERIPRGIQTESERIPRVEESREEKNTPHSPPEGIEFESWVLHYEQTTGHSLPARTTKAFKSIAESYAARLAEGYSAHDLQLATTGAHADDYRRENGYDVAESILRPTKIAALIAKGKLRTGGGARAAKSSLEIARDLRGGAA